MCAKIFYYIHFTSVDGIYYLSYELFFVYLHPFDTIIQKNMQKIKR